MRITSRCGRRLARLASLAVVLFATAPSAAMGATVRIPFPRDPGALTPLTFELGYPLLTLVYDTVTWRDPAGVPRPWLARSVRAVDGGRRVLVRLRAGPRWHDGRPLTARDVAFTYDFMRARRHPRFAPQLTAIASVRARDDRTVEFRLRHPSIGFADQPLADVPILPAHLWRGLAPGLRAPSGAPVGSGPYRYASLRPDGGLNLTAVRKYFRGRPRADFIEIPIIPEARDMLAALRRGAADTLPFTLTSPQVTNVSSISTRIARGSSYLGTMLMFNVRRAPFDRVQVRRVIADALDLQRIARGAGARTPATSGFLHPRSRWAPRATAPLRRPGPGRPLRALGLPKIRVLAPLGDDVRREAGRQVVLALRRAGAAARLATLSRARLGRAVGEGGARPSFDVAIWSIPPLASHDPDFLKVVFGGGSAGVLNRSGYSSAAFDRLAAEVGAAPSVSARRQAVAALLGRLAHDAPAVPLLFSDGTFAYRSTSPAGWTFVAGSGILDKQSLLRDPPDRLPPRAAPVPPASDGDGGGPGLFGILGAGMLVVALVVGGAAALGRRR